MSPLTIDIIQSKQNSLFVLGVAGKAWGGCLGAHWGVCSMGGGASGYSRVSRHSTAGAGALEGCSGSGSSSLDMSSNNLVGSLEVVSYQIQVSCFFDCVLQWGNMASLKRACADVKIMLFRDHMNIWLHSFLIATPRYVFNSDFGVSLFVWTSRGMWTYAPQLKTQRCKISRISDSNNSYGVCQFNCFIGVWLYMWMVCWVANFQ